MKLATRMGRLGTETAFEVLVRARALEAQGKDVVHLEIGEPDFDTPANVIEAGCRGPQDRLDPLRPLRRVCPTCGPRSPTTSTAPAAPTTTRDHVVVTPGGKPIMFFVILALLEAGDEAIYPNPGFPIYESMINFTGATAGPARRCARSAASPSTSTSWQSLITPRTKLLIINSPGNPTGGVLNREEIERDRRAGGRARPDRAGRRDLQRDPLRGRARLDRHHARHGRADDHPRRLLEDLRDDRLAARLRRDAGRLRRRRSTS